MKTKTPPQKEIKLVDLDALLKSHGTNVYRLSKTAKITKATLYAFKMGRGNPSLDTLSAIATALNITHVELLQTVDK